MPQILEHFKRALDNTHPPIVIEIGAARGEDTEALVGAILESNRHATFEYYAFEPDPRNIAALQHHHVIDFIHLIQAAVGESNRRAVFYQSGGTNPQFGYEHTLSGSLKKPIEHLLVHPWCTFARQCEVRVLALDDFCNTYGIPYIDFIWCDVQGAEDLVLAGGARALEATRFFYTEYYDTAMYEGQIAAREIHDRLPGSWRVVEQWPNDILFENVRPRFRG